MCESLDSEYVCEEGDDTLAVQKKTQVNDTCNTLTKKPGSGESVELIKTDNQDYEHLLLKYSTDVSCPNSTENYGIKFEIFCDENANEDPVPERNDEKSTDCMQYIEMTSKHGCKVGDLNGIWRFVDDNSWIFCIVFMVVGAFYIILGRILLKPTLFIIGTMTVVAIILFLFYVLILPNNVEEWAGWVILSCATLLGLIAGFFAAKLVRIGASLLAAWAGASIALLLSNMAFYKIESVAVLWVMI